MKFFFLCCFLLLSRSVLAETIAQKRLALTTHLTPLEKITLGPNDSYQASVNSSATSMVFVEKINFAPHLTFFDLTKSRQQDFIDRTFDSDQPSLDSTGEKVVFRSFQNEARGQICWQHLKQTDAHCLRLPEGEKLSPFWIGSHQIGFVLRDPNNQQTSLQIHDLETQKTQLLIAGDLSNPSANRNGTLIAYVGKRVIKGELQARLVLLETSNKQITLLSLAVPGVSGFPVFSKKEDFLYFTQYLSDSNNDQVIDAADRSLIMRIPLPVVSEQEIVPEPLTSLEHNCSFPYPASETLYVTCDFEGSLDIYRLPLTGIRPLSWTKETLWQAHQTARTYEERIFLLQSLQAFSPQDESLRQRLFSNHFFRDDMISAAAYWRSHGSELDEAVQIYLQARKRKKALGNQDLTPAFQRAVEKDLKTVDTHIKTSHLREVLKAHLALDILNLKALKTSLLTLQRSEASSPFEAHLFNLVIERIQEETFAKSMENSLEPMLERLLSLSFLSEEARISYLYRYLRHYENEEPSLRLERSRRLSKAVKDESLKILLQGEILSLQLLLEPQENNKKKIYTEFDQLLSSHRNQYHLKRALAMGAIRNLVAANQYKYMQFVSSQFFSFTDKRSPEFFYARDFFITTVLDRAYEAMVEKQWAVAQGHFFGSMILTDDLESHQGYIQSTVLNGESTKIKKNYEDFKKRNITSENMTFVEAILPLMTTSLPSLKTLDQAIDQLEQIKGQTQPIYYLVLGYCYLEKLTQTQGGPDLNVAEKTNRALSLALDLARDNQRVRASSLDALAVLHSHLQNWGLAARFLDLRQNLVESDANDQHALMWLKARALYHINDFAMAVETLNPALTEITGQERAAFLERQAFYSLNQKDYKKAQNSYAEFWKTVDLSRVPALDQSKIYLSSGFVLLENNQKAEAKDHFLKALSLAKNFADTNGKSDKKNLLKRPELRVQLHALGFLSQVTQAKEQQSFLRERKELLNSLKSHLDDLRMKPEMRLVALAKNDLLLAQSQLENDQNPLSSFQDLLQDLEDLGDQLTTTYTSDHLKGLYGVLILLKQTSLPRLDPELQNLFNRIQKDGAKIKNKSVSMMSIDLKLQLAMASHLKAADQGKGILQSDLALNLKQQAPELFEGLELLQSSLFKP